MRRWTIRAALLALALLVAVGLWQRQTLTRLHAVITLFDADRIAQNFTAMDALFFHAPVPVAADAAPLPAGPPMDPPPGFEAWLDRRAVTAIVVLHEGRVVHERYRQGDADDLRISWSVAKSYLSLLFGVLLDRGAIASLDDPVTAYAPMLKGTAYDGVSIRHVLTMSSGVAFDEDYFDFWSDINRMGRTLALGGSMDRFAAAREARTGPPGARWRYVSIDTHVLSMVLRGAAGEDIPTLLARHLLSPLGVRRQPYYVTDRPGVAFVLGGLNMTTRDYARMGELVRRGGVFDGRRIVPATWVAESTASQAPGNAGYGYQWWVPDGGPVAALARGVYGQYVYIEPDSGVVIAVNAADLRFREAGAYDDALAMFRRIAARLKEPT